jgi:uncharacterized protein YjbI with pentapeptide repeats
MSGASRPSDEPRYEIRSAASEKPLWSFKWAITSLLLIGVTSTVIAALAVIAVLGFPKRPASDDLSLEQTLDIVRFAFFVTAGLGASVGLLVTYRRQRVAEQDHVLAKKVHSYSVDSALSQRNDERERLSADVYSKALGLLESEAPSSRIGAIHALERLGQADPGYRQLVVDVICGYLRLPYRPLHKHPSRTEDRSDAEKSAARREAHVRWAAQDVLRQHTIQRGRLVETEHAYLGSGRTRNGYPNTLRPFGTEFPSHWSGMHVNLRFANLIDFDLEGADLSTADFSYASFYGNAHLGGLRVDGGASFKGCRFFNNAFFHYSKFGTEVDFTHCRYHGIADFSHTEFVSRASFVRASFKRIASFNDCQFKGYVNFDGSCFKSMCKFSDSLFMDGASFSIITFALGKKNGSYNAPQFRGQYTWFDGAIFSGDLNMRHAKFFGEVRLKGTYWTEEGRSKTRESTQRDRIPSAWHMEPTGELMLFPPGQRPSRSRPKKHRWTSR